MPTSMSRIPEWYVSLPRHANRRHAIVQAVLRTVMLSYELQVRDVCGDIEGVVAIVGGAVQRCAPSRSDTHRGNAVVPVAIGAVIVSTRTAEVLQIRDVAGNVRGVAKEVGVLVEDDARRKVRRRHRQLL